MPYCLQQCGILLGTILIGLCSLLTKVTCHLLYQGAVMTRRRSLESLALHAFGTGGRRLVEVLVFLFVILPLSLFRNLSSLSGISSVTVFFYFIFVLRMLIECIPRIFDGKWSADVHWWRQEGLLTRLV
ncbi:unnamed protein product [Gongylonema pulchrum]|uniref:Na_H_Exchanger domain-containing protein n=1 Tax=Gongylonema pulchrum TaxID=637853 RepID=A0A183EMZ9_9BILA|nr:unnamed protein product [Gongylonema pulchrum]